MSEVQPSTIFIIPFRDRYPQKAYFEKYFRERVSNQKGMENAKYFFIHQKDTRPFNRGAVKNLGFLILSKKYSNWRDITFVFHDIDHYPMPHIIFPYTTEIGTVKHYFGFKHTLGGVVVIKGMDYAKTNGFPMFWGWGYEDNQFNERVVKSGLKIDRSLFIDFVDNKLIKNSLEKLDGEGVTRAITKEDVVRFYTKKTDDMRSIRDVSYKINDTMVDVTNFVTNTLPGKLYEYDVRSSEKNLMKYIKGKGVIVRNRRWGLDMSF